ncbi:hypothetical protein [Streptomyces sp. CAU 1734]|uniref:hypothetical protein n=1 Tax=Streptomyces sp. CAU 1734 TaxID=3140360 RepID=UPI003260B46B
MPVDVWGLDGLTLSGLEARGGDAAMIMANGTAAGSRSGVRPGDPGLTTTLAGSTINVSAGVATVAYAGQGVYRVWQPSSVSPGSVAAAHATLPRVDLVYLRVWDTAVDGAGLAKADVVYLAGTASASPVAPTPAGTMVYMPLATISVPASGGGSPTVSLAVRPVTVAPGGIVPDAAATGLYVGQYRDNGTGLQRWSGSAWVYPEPLGIGSSLYRRKSADTPRTTATLADDLHLIVPVVANAEYTIDGMLHWITTDATNADMNLDFGVPAGSSGTYLGFAQPTSAGATDTDGPIRTMSTPIDTARLFGASTASGNPSGLMLRAVLVTAGTAGNFSVQFARSGGSGTVTLLAHSWIDLRRRA